jgi:hypothetical protein
MKIQEQLKNLDHLVAQKSIANLPLYGIPFAIKDNIDAAGWETTVACPDFAFEPQKNATVVQKLIDAGAILVGKTNLDQFATGLVGTRSPFGAVPNTFDPSYVSGGSSSGSASVVARGLACFSLGTDTAGSGRIPAAFNNLVIKFSNFYQVKSGPGKIGRPRRLLHKSQALGCILVFYSDKMGYKTLCQMFGIPMASLSRVIKQAEDALLLALKSEPDAQIRWPSLDQQVSWAQRVQAKHPLVTGRWGFIDGKNLRVQKPSDAELQNAMYNGWLHSTLVTGTICFGFVCLYIYYIFSNPKKRKEIPSVVETCSPWRGRQCRRWHRRGWLDSTRWRRG